MGHGPRCYQRHFCEIPFVGIATAIAMMRLRMREGRADAAQFLIVPLFDMLAFSIAFGLGFRWRKKPEFHRRLMLIATCSLTAAAFGRFPDVIMPHNWFYAGVDVLILLGGGARSGRNERRSPCLHVRTSYTDLWPDCHRLCVRAKLASVGEDRARSARVASSRASEHKARGEYAIPHRRIA